MTSFIVTVKDQRNPNHDPRSKQTGPCKWSPMCTDVTGQHHSFLETRFGDADSIRMDLETQGVHVTRIEEVAS